MMCDQGPGWYSAGGRELRFEKRSHTRPCHEGHRHRSGIGWWSPDFERIRFHSQLR